MCATRDLWLAKRLLNKGKALVQISMAAPEKNDLWARTDRVRGLKGASVKGSISFLPTCEVLQVEIAFLEGSRL